MHPNQLARLDGWIKKIGETISRPEAIRRLVEIGLADKRRPARLWVTARPVNEQDG